MPPPTPPVEACIRAWELYGQHYPWPHVAELLRAEGYDGHDRLRWPKCGSYETARQWGHKGRDLSYTKEALDRGGGRERMLAGLEQDMASLRERVRVTEGEALFEAMSHFKWMYPLLAKLIGTDAQPPPQHVVVSDERAQPTPPLAAEVRLTLAQPDPEEAL